MNRKMILVLGVFLVVSMVAGCSLFDTTKMKLAGLWQTDTLIPAYIEFRDDGSYVAEEVWGTFPASGSYSISDGSGDLKIIRITGNNGDVHEWSIISLTDTSLVVRYDTGSTQRFTKVEGSLGR